MNTVSKNFLQFKTCLEYNFKFFMREKKAAKRSDIFFEFGTVFLMNVITGVWICLSILQDCSLFLFSQKIIFMHILVFAWSIISSFSMHLFVVDNQQHKRFFSVLPVAWFIRSLSYFCLSLFIFLIPVIILSLTVAIFFTFNFGFITGVTTFFSILITGISALFISGLLFVFLKFTFTENIFFIVIAISESIGFFAIKFLLMYGIRNADFFDEKFIFVPGINHIWVLYKNMNSQYIFSQTIFFVSFAFIVFFYSLILNVYLTRKPKVRMNGNTKIKQLFFSNSNTDKLITALYKKIIKNDVICKKNLYMQISKILTFPILVLLISLRIGNTAKFDINQYMLMFIFFVAGSAEIIISGYYSTKPEANWIVKLFNEEYHFFNLKRIYYTLRIKKLLLILIPLIVCSYLILFGLNIAAIFTTAVILFSFFIFYFTMIQIFSDRVPFVRNETDIITDVNSVSMKAWIFIPLIYIGFKKTFQNYLGMIIFSIALILFAVFQYRRAYCKLKNTNSKGDTDNK
ncbi:hypothetical protein [Treponema pedis]|uniref:hypothetical protein n=2 Tax=Treponema pedis TaxID=409322 RepID=UPI003D257160